jgi:hypothetical protein
VLAGSGKPSGEPGASEDETGASEDETGAKPEPEPRADLRA